MSNGSDSLELSSGSNYAGMMVAASDSNPDSSVLSQSSGLTDIRLAGAAVLTQNAIMEQSQHSRSEQVTAVEPIIQFGNFNGPDEVKTLGSGQAFSPMVHSEESPKRARPTRPVLTSSDIETSETVMRAPGSSQAPSLMVDVREGVHRVSQSQVIYQVVMDEQLMYVGVALRTLCKLSSVEHTEP